MHDGPHLEAADGGKQIDQLLLHGLADLGIRVCLRAI